MLFVFMHKYFIQNLLYHLVHFVAISITAVVQCYCSNYHSKFDDYHNSGITGVIIFAVVVINNVVVTGTTMVVYSCSMKE